MTTTRSLAVLLALLLAGCSGNAGGPAEDGTTAGDLGQPRDLPSETSAPADVGSADVTNDAGADAGAAEDVAAPWPWPTCAELRESHGSLADKTRALDELVPRQHLLAADGLLRSVRLDEDGAVTGREHLPSTGLWTAIYLASQSFRYAVTGEQAAQDNARLAAEGLHHLTAVTGVPGLYGRAYQRPDTALYVSDASGSPSWVASTAPGYEGWWWNHDVSKDTMDGIVFGYAVALEFLDDPEILATIRADLVAFVDHLVGNGLRIIDHHGEVTEHGRLYYSAVDDLPGFNAILSTSWIRVAIDAADDPEWVAAMTHFYEDCLMRLGPRDDCPAVDWADLGSYLEAIETLLFVYRPDCVTSYDNIDMVFHAVYPLLRREQHPDLRERLLAVLDVGIWEPVEEGIAPPVHRSGHTLYTVLYGGLARPTPDDPVFAAALADGICTLYRLPQDRRDLTIAAGTQEPACTNRLGHPNAAERIPLEERYYDNYLWRLDPYEIPEAHDAVPGQVHSPEDYLLAYWAARYFGYLTPDM